MEYVVDPKNYFRLRQPRPRFKGQVEDVLLFMAEEISRLGELPETEFDHELDKAIRRFPGNINQKPKTTANWRTEIDALFGLIVREDGFAKPTMLAKNLANTGDLVSFFRTMLAKFQYPGGHVKPKYVGECIRSGIKFKPAQFVIRVLLEGQKQNVTGNGSDFGITKAEATALIWNDLAVTTGVKSPLQVADDLLANRDLFVEYEQAGDVVRYAGDILDYMVLGNILTYSPVRKKYYLVPGEQTGANLVLSQKDFFPGYEIYYKRPAQPDNLFYALEASWFDWVGNQINGLVLDTDPLEILLAPKEVDGTVQDQSESELAHELLEYLRGLLKTSKDIGTKDIGNTGESIIMLHEANRLRELGAANLASKVKKIPDHLGIGYDIKSFLNENEDAKLIEVKSSISRGALALNQFHLTKNEWKAADASGSAYYIYRVLISSASVRCFVIHDPVDKYKKSLLKMTISEGADISYKEESGHWEQLNLKSPS